MPKLKRLVFMFDRWPVKDHNWIATASWRWWGRLMVTVHVVRFRDTQFSVAFWVGFIGDCWPVKGQPNKAKWEVHSS
jgi:hypothetical protein